VIPAGTELAPRNPGVDAWDGLGDNQRRLACRLQEAFAAFLDHTDDQIGRLVDGLRDMGQLDNTILLVLADNGASQEGGPFLQDDRFIVDYNAFNEHRIIESTVAVPAGDSTLIARLRRGAGRSGSISLEVDGQPAGIVEVPLVMMMISSVGASIGYNHGSAVSARYEAPFAFSGTLHSLEIQLIDDDHPAAQQARAAAEMSRQ
jgi:arylsulfatase A-like enzyme